MGAAHFMTAIQVLNTYKFEENRGTTVIAKDPIGVCGFITPWNWPVNQIACKGRCCTENFKSEVWALSPGSCGFLGGTDGIRTTGLKHAIQNRDADGGFGLLTCKGPCPKLRANNPFVSTHRGFRERAAAIAGRLLPFQSPFGQDHALLHRSKPPSHGAGSR